MKLLSKIIMFFVVLFDTIVSRIEYMMFGVATSPFVIKPPRSSVSLVVSELIREEPKQELRFSYCIFSVKPKALEDYCVKYFYNSSLLQCKRNLVIEDGDLIILFNMDEVLGKTDPRSYQAMLSVKVAIHNVMKKNYFGQYKILRL
ncbi:MAG: hypothetical protein ABF990_03660 [Acetobacter sp.]|uniref:hypothetical protein n=2 Tax=Acetobacter sp. TaxID=440 RepID=UPI0039EA4FDA